MQARIEAILRGEVVVPHSTAGLIPLYWGPDATAADVAARWLGIWRRAEAAGRMMPGDAAFYQANAIGWASR